MPPTDVAAWRRNSTPSSRSSTGIRSSAEWISRAASSGLIVRIGKNPYATVPNASRSQWESVNPATQIGASRAPGSIPATNDSIADQSGVPSSERVPPWPSRHSTS